MLLLSSAPPCLAQVQISISETKVKVTETENAKKNHSKDSSVPLGLPASTLGKKKHLCGRYKWKHNFEMCLQVLDKNVCCLINFPFFFFFWTVSSVPASPFFFFWTIISVSQTMPVGGIFHPRSEAGTKETTEFKGKLM